MAPSKPNWANDSVTDFVINKGNGVKGLSETGIKTLPEQYIQPLEERTMSKVMVGESIPIIDASNWEDPKVGAAICDAAEKWGFFQIINHGIPQEVLDNVKNATYRFFDSPAEEKNKYSKENSVSNNVRYTTSFIPTVEKALEWKDYLSLFYVSEDEASKLWPSSCKDEVLAYMHNGSIVVKRLLSVLLKGLNVTEIDSEKEQLVTGSKRVNLNFYPVCPNPELTVGVGRHSDVSAFTVLLQDDIGGLYVRVEGKDSWVHVPPVKGSLVINIGDALQIFSNGRYRSIEHRVVANGNSNRISVPLFINPRPEDIIAPLPEVLASTGEKPIYKPILYSDYVRHFYRKSHDGKLTIDFAKA
ncbi:feruloyl CoA ortho-hydroxylase 1 [Morus notabilis]|uniref:feruloyl CoA ortho-hydroxylase 1-like n=2 Tax=Morus notabilis TaxID=981085 RepID=UPI000CED6E3E|nr:feruloyl CoA ortho-hydroxylase 1-like [Morus notabilis]XP_024022236.1 feruloyl CoA ortho-hydroxylase 1 [Morus notabilis]